MTSASEIVPFYRIFLLLVLFVSSSSLYGQQRLNIRILMVDNSHTGYLMYADSSGIYILDGGHIIGVPFTSIDFVLFGKSEVFDTKNKVDIKGMEDRYYAFLPFLKKKTLGQEKLEVWKIEDYKDYVFNGSLEDLKPVTVPPHVFFEFGVGPMFTPANEEMLDTFQPFGGTISFFGLTSTYPKDLSYSSNVFIRIGFHVNPSIDILATYRKYGVQEIAGIGDFNFTLRSRNIGFIFSYLLSTPDYFLDNRWRVGIGVGPSINNTESVVVLVESGTTDPFGLGLPITTSSQTLRESVANPALNFNFKIDYYFVRNFYLTSSLESMFSSKHVVESKDMGMYTFEGAEINTSTFTLSFGLGVSIY